MGCFGSRPGRENFQNSHGPNLIASNYHKLSESPPPWNRETMKSLSIPSTRFPSKISNPHHTEVEELRNINYFLFIKSDEILKNNLFHIFQSRGFTSSNLPGLIEIIYLNYQQNPFHNFSHGFAVCQLLYALSERNSKFQSYLTVKEEAILLLCALAHDINHPGVNNGFMINSKHAVAERFSNTAVLENYHAATLLDLLNHPLLHLEIDTQEKEKIIMIILATDMTQHKQVIETFSEASKDYSKENPLHRMSFMRMLLHGADISNPALAFELATVWSLKIIQEFNLQVWKEEQLSIPVSEFMRIGNDIGKIKRSQIVFIDMFIYPLWKAISEFLPNTTDLVENIENNRKNWELLENL